MGMAASQARYLALSARKTNTEYEGQQLNQQRLNLANQSADLFNQMLTMSVPTCPDSNDFTTLQYSWSDGINDSVISDYYQLGSPNEDYNYVVTSYHYEDVYTGAVKKMNMPQIQASKTNDFTVNPDKTYTVQQLTYHRESKPGAGDDSYTLSVVRNDVESTRIFKRADVNTDLDTVDELDALSNRTTKATAGDKATFTPKTTVTDPGTGAVTVTPAQWAFQDEIKIQVNNPEFDPKKPIDATNPRTIEASIPAGQAFSQVDFDDEAQADIVELLRESFGAKYDASKTYYATAVDTGKKDAEGNAIMTYAFVVGEDMDAAQGSQGEIAQVQVRSGDSTVYYTDGTSYLTAQELSSIDLSDPDNPIDQLNFHSAVNNPVFSNFTAVGNSELTELSLESYNENEDISTEIQQVIKDMKTTNPVAYANLSACFDPDTGEYLGGIYSFKMFGTTYYTTTADLESATQGAYRENATASNGIDSQYKLSYYKAGYISTKIEESKLALLETDGKGRFSTVKFEDDSVVYSLNCETITDEAAYQDAMNQYFYKQEKYDKQVADINAKTEIIQAEDRQLQLRLEQLGTEQTALQTEMEACQKVVSKNVETSFKTFGG
ncbi:MAG: hypothetical protein NC200_04005 [Candidatus Gastranaerophilales bacterium]|nr:hypothetical protein [Candidatus Gastranaerophilales bacterium]